MLRWSAFGAGKRAEPRVKSEEERGCFVWKKERCSES